MQEKEPREQSHKKQLTLAASHIFTVLSAEDVANMVEPGLNRTSVMRSECASEVLTQSRVSMFQTNACHQNYNQL